MSDLKPAKHHPWFRRRRGAALPGLLLAFLSGGVSAQSCPPEFGSGQICSASDFRVTGVVTEGPGACTEGDTIALTLRVGLTSTARQRYDIGLFAGNNGEPVLGGQSCTHTALVPLEPVFDPDSGSGPYRDLDGDACGDVDSGDPVSQRDFRLDSVLCRDNDGDGRLDLSGLVTWSINASQDVCSDPTDPASFFPSQNSKCQLDPDFNLPITVEPPPTLAVTKLALPANLPAPGGPVRFVVSVRNTSTATDPVTLTSLEDDIHGDLDNQGNCSLPRELAPGERYRCEFTANVLGNAGDRETDTVTAGAIDDEGEALTAFASATVTLTDAPASMQVLKVAYPRFISEPGGTVTYSVAVANTSDTESITLTGLEDDLYGNVFAKPGCVQPAEPVMLDPGEIMFCSFSEPVTGAPGDVITDTITATAGTAGGLTLEALDTASVLVLDVSSAIATLKSASPSTLPAPGGDVRFDVRVRNNSPTDSVTINSLVDTVYGDITSVHDQVLATDCGVPRQLPPGAEYGCHFTGEVTGSPGEFHVDYVVAEGVDDDGVAVRDWARAQVTIRIPGSASAIPLGPGWLAAAAVLLLGAGLQVLRSRR